MKLKFVTLAALSASAIIFSTSTLAAYKFDVKCLDEVTLTDVHAGYILSASGGPDIGNAVVISWETKLGHPPVPSFDNSLPLHFP